MIGRDGVALGARFVLLAAAAVVLMLADHRQGHLDRVRQTLSVAVYPLQLAVDLPFSTFEMLRTSMAERKALMVENDRLQRELRVARIRLQSFEALERKNEDLRRLVDAGELVPDLEIRLAEILTVDFENRHRFIINRGCNDGVYDCQALLDAEGVVGQVIAVSPITAEALLITDASHSIQVANVRTQERTILQGTGDRRELRLLAVTNEDDFVVGDLLVTTGYGGVYPRGRPVARISRVEPQPGRDFANVYAEPVAALDRAQEVLLVWEQQGKPAGCAAESAPSFAGLVQ
jgi:rod shape-determining protein MreC